MVRTQLTTALSKVRTAISEERLEYSGSEKDSIRGGGGNCRWYGGGIGNRNKKRQGHHLREKLKMTKRNRKGKKRMKRTKRNGKGLVWEEGYDYTKNVWGGR